MTTLQRMNRGISEKELPEIDCVVIGVNCSKTLGRCLDSIIKSNYPDELINIIYVDGGSQDCSIKIAQSYPAARTVALTPEYPSPGLGRNEGWKHGNAPLVMFLDSDTIMDRAWLMRSVHELADGVGAIMGNRVEIQPDASIFNWIASLEWNGKPGLADCFGGDVMVRREVLELTGGYDEMLVGGEDPELSQRVRMGGWSILHLDCVMTRHDLAMSRPGQYWRRAYRSGYGFAAVVDRHRNNRDAFWHREIQRIVIRGGGSLTLMLFSLVLLTCSVFATVFVALSLFLLCLSQLLLFFPRLFRVEYFAGEKNLATKQAKLYAWHCSVVVVPQFAGVVRYHYGRIFHRPLRNQRSRLATALL